MNLIEVVSLLVFMIIGLVSLTAVWGASGSIALAALAFVVGLVTGPAALLAIVWIYDRVCPEHPSCTRGRCRGWQYNCVKVIGTKYVDPTRAPRAALLRCRCNDEYVRVGERLLLVGDDGNWHPFARRIGVRRWAADSDGEVLAASITEVVWAAPDGRSPAPPSGSPPTRSSR